MNKLFLSTPVAAFLVALPVSIFAETTDIVAGLNAPVIGASGGSSIYWGPVVAQTSLSFSGNTNTNYPKKYAGTTISGSGGVAGARQYCANPGDPTSGPGTVIPPSSVPVYEWYCSVDPVPPAPQVDFDYYKLLAQAEGNACAGQPCYNTGDMSFSGTYDPVCSANGHTKVWFFEGDVSFSGSTYFCGVLLSRGAISFTGGGNGNITSTPPANAWEQYEVATPNGAAGSGDTVAQDEYPGDAGLHTTKPYNFVTGGGGFNGDPVTFRGYIYATTGYSAQGHTLVVGAVQFGQGVASTGGGGTIFYEPQTIFTIPPANTVTTPIITPPGGSFTGSVLVSIAVATQGALIYYTTNGATPNQSSTPYTGPFTLTADTTVKAIAVRSGMNNSSVATADFTIQAGPANQPADVDAGSDQTVVIANGATLAGGATDDGLPNPPGVLAHAWNKFSGPGVATFTDPSSYTSGVSFSQVGTYVLRLSVYDGQYVTSDDVQIVVTKTPPPAVSFSAASYTTGEGSGVAVITVTRQGIDLSGSSSVQFRSSNGTALAGLDYTGVSGLLTFSVNQTSKTFQVPILMDRLVEGNETVQLVLELPSECTLGTSNAVLTITDVSPQPDPSPSPFISSLVPYAAPVNFALSFPMRVVGADFDATNAVVIWNNAINLPVVSRSTTEIVVTMSPSVWNSTVGTYPIKVRNPGNVDSNNALFFVRQIGEGSAPPYVVEQPTANPNPTYTKTSNLSVLGGTLSSGGESVLRYEWRADGAQPGSYTFSANNTNAAKVSIVTFGGPGVYRFYTAITDTVTGFAVHSNVIVVTVMQQPTSLTLAPKYQVITADQQLNLHATVLDQFGVAMNPLLNWTSTGGSLAANQTSAILSVDTTVRTVRITASMPDASMTDFADVAVVYGSGGVGDISQAVPSPVPYKANSGLPGVTFRRLNAGTRIRLFSTDGRLIQTLNSADGSDTLWPLTNSSGDRVASGVYLYIIDWNALTRKGKVVLIL